MRERILKSQLESAKFQKNSDRRKNEPRLDYVLNEHILLRGPFGVVTRFLPNRDCKFVWHHAF